MELHNSHLGDQEYWDKVYVTELENYNDNKEDVGEIWFGERTEQKIVGWITDNVAADAHIADIGTGNGHLLSLLADEDYSNLTGIDYSPSSIALASTINADKQITFECRDILAASPPGSHAGGKYDVCLDKGTYDAISLSSTSATDRQKYKLGIQSLVAPDTGRFLLASVNWTSHELEEFFSDCFTVAETVPCRKFTFGGVTGQDVSIVVFKHRT